MNEQILLYMCVGGAVAGVAFFVSRLALGAAADAKLRERLEDADRPGGAAHGPSATQTVVPILQKIGQAAAQPFMPKSRQKVSSLRRDLGYAGIYSASAVKLVTGAKVLCLLGGVLIGYLLGALVGLVMLGTSVGGLVGYLMPRMWLKSRIRANQRALTIGLPDALDLLVVCVEAGLTIDSAMQRVGQELNLAHPAVARELGIAHMETRVGLSRQEALKNLGVRTGNAALQSLAAMLIQADRFGTSIAGALRIHADSLRTKRQHAAEEMAAKASVKLSFPLVLFIFPATFIVLAGPTVIGLMKSALFND
ncbi:type II secretion system F family protein [Fontivita pretiosa]|uniref:type II secretion system F family protein n=1 Tax=Fontivita pretiosa TaxID=2989684 RepID=UPI003D1846B8